jgi:hypothetical protein
VEIRKLWGHPLARINVIKRNMKSVKFWIAESDLSFQRNWMDQLVTKGKEDFSGTLPGQGNKASCLFSYTCGQSVLAATTRRRSK